MGGRRGRDVRKRAGATGDAAQQLARARRLCLGLPDATEKTAWGAPTFRIGGRLFAIFANDHHGDGRIALWCKAPPGAQASLVGSEPERFFVPPYVGKDGWIGIVIDRNSDAEVAYWLEQGYQLAAAASRRR